MQEKSLDSYQDSIRFYLLNRSSGVYLSEYDGYSVIKDIALYDTSYAELGKTDTENSVNEFTFGSDTYNLINYITKWPSDYGDVKNAVRTELNTYFDTYRNGAADGSLLPQVEFTGM